MEDFLHFNKVLESLKAYPKSERGYFLFSGITAFTSPKELEEELKMLRAAYAFLDSGEGAIFPECLDITKRFENAHKTGLFAPEEFLSFALEYEHYAYLKGKFELCGGPLKDYVAYGPDLDYLVKEIRRIFVESGEIKDKASSELYSIRLKIASISSSMEGEARKLALANQSYLNSPEPLYRDGRYVLSFKSSYKNKLSGMILGYSGSGETAYVLPARLLDLENKLEELRSNEKAEIRKILIRLTKKTLEYESEIAYIEEKHGYLDYLFARARWGKDQLMDVPTLSQDRSIALKGLFHPGLGHDKSILNDLYLDESKRFLLLSGPNAGGKTVLMLSLGIAAMSFMHGLPVAIKEGSSLPFFSGIYGDIGDNQSLEDSLSTFAAHMENVGRALAKADEDSLVLFDELGSGTSPLEGEAIALAVSEEVLEKKCFGVVSSHFEALKAFAIDHRGAINGSFSYDEQGIKPTYRLQMGVPGESLALTAAAAYGLDEKILERAKKHLEGQSDFSVSEALRKLKEQYGEYEALSNDLSKEKAQYDERLARLEKQQEELDRRRASLKEEAAREKDELLQKAEEKIKEAMALLEKGSKTHELIKARKELEELRESKVERTFDEALSVGDYVEIPSYEAEGRIMKIQGKRAEVNGRDGFTYKIETKYLRKTKEPALQKEMKARVRNESFSSLPLELNMLGMRYEEAQEALARYLDACRVKGIKRVRIIHGFGTGALRRMTEEYLNGHSEFVLSYERAGASEGGLGATIVKLR